MSAVAEVAKPALTAHDLKAAIRARYEAPEWHVEDEVTLAGRRLDLVAFNLWGSRNYRVVGFELKVSRGDWLRELDAFQKSEDWCAVVDAFYVVTPPKLVRDDELPAGWGLLELNGSRMMTRRHAAVREGVTTIPREVSARFLSRMAFRAESATNTARYQMREAVRKEERDRAEKELGAELKAAREKAQESARQYSELLAALGLRTNEWRAHEAAIRAAGLFAKDIASPGFMIDNLNKTAAECESRAARMREAVTALSAPTPFAADAETSPNE